MLKTMKTLSVATIVAATIILSATDCSVIAKGDLNGAGVGAPCSATQGCHAGVCENGICVASCTSNADCPTPSGCFGSVCQLPLKVSALWVGVVAGGEGWTLTHQEGMTNAAQAVPYMSWDYKENIVGPPVDSAIDDAVKGGAQVIVANSVSQRDQVEKKAAQYPNVKFLLATSYWTNGKNAGSFAARLEQAWYVAGKVAASKASKRIGIIGSFITPESIRYINAYARGAQSVNPNIVVEVNWIGFWSDYQTTQSYPYQGQTYFREELLARRLIDSGCEVIAHLADNQRSVRLIEALTTAGTISKVWSLTNDNDNAYRQITANGPGDAFKSCLGGPYWNWAPLYGQLFDQIHRGVWAPGNINLPMQIDATKSIVSFQLNPVVGVDDSVVHQFINDAVQAGPNAVFVGPYDTTGQRSKGGGTAYDAVQSVAAGEVLADSELLSMCWFVKGIVERRVPTDPSTERPALVPDDRNLILNFDPTVLDPPGAPHGVAFNCRAN